MNSKFAGFDGEQVWFAEDFEEFADLEEFLEYQDQLHLEEAVRELLHVDIEDGTTIGLSLALPFFCSFLCPVGIKPHFLQSFVLASFKNWQWIVVDDERTWK